MSTQQAAGQRNGVYTREDVAKVGARPACALSNAYRPTAQQEGRLSTWRGLESEYT